MSIKSERLERRIQEIQQFVNDKIERGKIFEAVSKELARIAYTLKQGKLTVQIVSYNRVSAQKLQNFLHKYDALQEVYRITLGYERQLEPGTELLCESDNNFQQLVSCNILCLVIAPNQMHKIYLKQLIQKLSNTQVSTLVVVVEIPEVTGETAIQANTIKNEVRVGLQTDSNNAEIEVYSTCQSDLEMFCRSLGTLNKRRAEDILIKQVTAQTLTQITLIENFLIKQHRELEKEHQQAQASLPIVGGDRRRQFDETIRLINNEKASVIKEIKSSVNQSVTNLLTKLYSESIIHQLCSNIDALKPEIVKKKEGYIHIRLVEKIKKPNPKKQVNLKTDLSLNSYFRQLLLSKLMKFNLKSKYQIELVKEYSVDANTIITEYYRRTLTEWAAKEWENVCDIYAKGGLRRFFQTTYERLKSIPFLNIESSLWEPSQYIDISHIFTKKIEKPNSETSYRQISLLGFIFGRIRSNLMPFLSISFLLSILGIANRRQIARWFFQPVFSAYESAPIPTIIILTLVIYFLLKVLFQTYNKHNLAEMKKEEEKLKDKIFQSYSDIIQHLTDKIHKEILSAIEIKEQWMDENIQAYRQLLDQTSEAAERNQPLIKKQIEQQKEQLKKLNQELGDLQKLKRNLN